MNRILFSIVGLFLIFAVGCKPKDALVSSKDTANTFGSDFKVEKVMKLDEVMAMLQTKESLDDVVVEGQVEGVCQAKGCWMNLSNGKNKDKTMFVKFQDYGFFMPLDLTGNVVMKGKAFKEETSVEELRHYAEDEGKSQEEIAAITEPKVELKFIATGVKIKY